MIPYYKDDLATIYLGDSEMLLQEIDADVVISDPPYGINYSPSESGKSQWTKKTFVGKTVVTNDNRKFDPTPLVGSEMCIRDRQEYFVIDGWVL